MDLAAKNFVFPRDDHLRFFKKLGELMGLDLDILIFNEEVGSLKELRAILRKASSLIVSHIRLCRKFDRMIEDSGGPSLSRSESTNTSNGSDVVPVISLDTEEVEMTDTMAAHLMEAELTSEEQDEIIPNDVGSNEHSGEESDDEDHNRNEEERQEEDPEVEVSEDEESEDCNWVQPSIENVPTAEGEELRRYHQGLDNRKMKEEEILSYIGDRAFLRRGGMTAREFMRKSPDYTIQGIALRKLKPYARRDDSTVDHFEMFLAMNDVFAIFEALFRFGQTVQPALYSSWIASEPVREMLDNFMWESKTERELAPIARIPKKRTAAELNTPKKGGKVPKNGA